MKDESPGGPAGKGVPGRMVCVKNGPEAEAD